MTIWGLHAVCVQDSVWLFVCICLKVALKAQTHTLTLVCDCGEGRTGLLVLTLVVLI